MVVKECTQKSCKVMLMKMLFAKYDLLKELIARWVHSDFYCIKIMT